MLKKIGFFTLFLSLSFIFSGCQNLKTRDIPFLQLSAQGNKILTIDAQQVDCVAEGPRTCLRVKEDKSPRWSLWYTPINGFEYERGHNYVIEVSSKEVENPPADGSSIEYTLVRIISKD